MTALNRLSFAMVLLVSLQQVGFAQLQLIPASDAQLFYVHHHLYVSNVDAQTKFWVDTLGGTPAGRYPNTEIELVSFPNVMMSLSPRAPTGGTKGTTVNHIGFQVPNLRAMVETVRAAGYPIVTRAELSTTVEVKDDLAYIPNQDTYIAFVMAPDDIKVELLENRSLNVPILSHHVHFAAPNVDEMKAWYVQVFGATPGTRGSFEAADIPGVNLTFSPSAESVAPTRGRALDHIGVEIKNLEQFCKDLEAKGIKLDRGYAKAANSPIGIAILTDPWGTRIELSEGYDTLF